MVRVKSAPDIG